MSDNDKRYEDAEKREQAQPAYDPWDRKAVDPSDPSFAGSNRNRVNSDDFGFISAELAEADVEKDETESLPENDTKRKDKGA